MTAYEIFHDKLRRIADVGYASAVLNWDQETYMPPKGAALRAQQLATLAGIAHEMMTDKALGELFESLSKDETLDDRQRRNVKETLRQYEKSLKYPTAFVEEISRCVSEAFIAWQEAKKTNNFQLFLPKLEQLVALKRKECELLGYEKHPYDALLDNYEPGLTTAELTQLFNDVRAELVDFVKQLAAQPTHSDALLTQFYPKDQQWAFGIELLKEMGYDFDAGRQDISTHPFTTNFSPEDVRITTRIDEHNLADMVSGSIHEGGHALYEQGLPVEEYGLPGGEYLSLGIHESQSRLWENNVGRGLAFWKANTPLLKKHFPEHADQLTPEAIYSAMNVVRPSLIRINADELTYHFHILIRFEIEKALIEGSIEARDLPAFWNSRYKEYLGVDVPSDDQGVLQDIHWSHGSFGYFPTYSLGSFYAAQFYAAARKAIPELEAEIEKGNMAPLLRWLRENIHQHGRLYTAAELCQNVTGEALNFKYFMDYARAKYGALYSIR